MAKRKATPPKAAEPVVKEEETESTNGSNTDVEMKEEDNEADVDDKETEEKKEVTPLFVPSINEFRRDLGHYYNSRTLIVGPVKFTELNRGKLSIVTQKAEFCQVKLAKGDNGVLQGYIELVFESEDQAVSALAELESYTSTGVIIKHMKYVDNKPVDIEDVVSQSIGLNGKIENTDASAEKVLVVSQLPADVTAADIKEKLKEARTVLFPVSHVTGEKKSYAYVELPFYKNVKYHEGWNLTFGEHKSKCKILERIPKVQEVLRDLRNLKPRFQKKEDLGVIGIQELKSLMRHGTHFQRSEWVDDEKKESLKTLLEASRTYLKSRSQKNFKSNRPNNKPMQLNSNLSQLQTSLSLLAALSNSNSFGGKKQKMGRNQRW